MRYRNAFFESFGITLPNPTIYDVMIISKTVNPMPWFRFDKYRDWYNAGDITYDDAEADDKFVNGYYTTGAARCHFTADFMDFSFKNLDADGKYIGEEGERLYSDEHIEAVKHFLRSESMTEAQKELLYDVLEVVIFDINE